MTDSAEPTPERKRRSAFVVGPAVATEAGPARAGSRVYRAQPMLERLAKAGVLDPRQAQAGDRLRADWELGVEGAREPAGGSSAHSGWHYADVVLAAVRSCENALFCLGPTKPVVIAVAILDQSISEVARHSRKNRQEVAGILKLGLTELADHYGGDCDRTKIRHNLLTNRNRAQKHSGNRS